MRKTEKSIPAYAKEQSGWWNLKMEITDKGIQKLFSRAYVLGGSPCSGKSTIAERLSYEFSLQYYRVDEHERQHLIRCDPNLHQAMHRYSKMSWNERWMRPVPYQVEELFNFYRERFELIVQDLGRYDPEQEIVLEGAAYLPELLERNNANQQRVIFLVPTMQFQLYHYRQREWTQYILNECEDPKITFDNWMLRDHQFGQEILRQARKRKYETILVDEKLSIDDLYDEVKQYFGF